MSGEVHWPDRFGMVQLAFSVEMISPEWVLRGPKQDCVQNPGEISLSHNLKRIAPEKSPFMKVGSCTHTQVTWPYVGYT